MPTPSERKALVFLASLALLGGGVRLARAARETPTSSAGSRRALAAQLARVDSARARDGEGAPRRRPRKAARPARGEREAAGPSAQHPIDLDVATAAEIDRLPGIGPVLAARIVARRDSCGTFGAMVGLERVPGVGPRLAERIRPVVTFSGARRAPNTVRPGCEAGARQGGARGTRGALLAASPGAPRGGRKVRHSAPTGVGSTMVVPAPRRPAPVGTRTSEPRATPGSRRGVTP